jgi:hypothetical protein
MSLVVIGGQSRNVGKTSIVAGLISALASLNWTAIKITPHEHTLTADHRYAITEEVNRAGRKDTSRYLAAGARRSLLLETRPDAIKEAVDAVLEQTAGSENVILESNAVVEFLRPDIYLVVLDPSVPDFKRSARRMLDRADAVITTEAPLPEEVARLLTGKPVFRVSSPACVSPELLKFIGARIGTN